MHTTEVQDKYQQIKAVPRETEKEKLMASYSNIPRNPYILLGSRPATNPVINSNDKTGTGSTYFKDGSGERYSTTVKTIVQRVPPSAMPVESLGVVNDRPQIVNEFLKNIQNEVSHPAWPSTMYQPPYGFPSAAPTVQFDPTTRVTNGMPNSVTESGFVVQSRVTPPTIRTTPVPPRPNARISRAMNDISEATEYLKELTRTSIPNSDTITVPQNMVPSRPAAVNKASAPETITSREAATRYKNVIVSTEPYDKQSSTLLLDSNAAKDKYKGVFV